MNVVMTGDGRFVEVQGTAEGPARVRPRRCSATLLDLATKGCAELTALQQDALAAPARERLRVTRRLVLATRNEHKVHELRQILADAGRRARARGRRRRRRRRCPDVAETEVTFVGNARLKAVALAAGHRPARASPTTRAGRRRARRLAGRVQRPLVGVDGWAGAGRADRDRANLELLLEQVADVPDEHRAAAFVCAAVARPARRTGSRASRAGSRDAWRGTRAAPTASATTRSSRASGRRPPHPGRVHRRGEERDLAPRARVPRDGTDPEEAADRMTDLSPRPAKTDATRNVPPPLGGGSTAAPPDQRVEEPTSGVDLGCGAQRGHRRRGVDRRRDPAGRGSRMAGHRRGHALADSCGRRCLHRPDAAVAQGLRGLDVRDQRQAGADRRDGRRARRGVRRDRRALQAAGSPRRPSCFGVVGCARDGRGHLAARRPGPDVLADPARDRGGDRHAVPAAAATRATSAYRRLEPAARPRGSSPVAAAPWRPPSGSCLGGGRRRRARRAPTRSMPTADGHALAVPTAAPSSRCRA